MYSWAVTVHSVLLLSLHLLRLLNLISYIFPGSLLCAVMLAGWFTLSLSSTKKMSPWMYPVRGHNSRRTIKGWLSCPSHCSALWYLLFYMVSSPKSFKMNLYLCYETNLFLNTTVLVAIRISWKRLILLVKCSLHLTKFSG